MRLVERQGECSKLGGVVAQVAGTGGGLAVIEGPPGIGKSALLEWLQRHGATEGVDVRIVRGTSLGAEVAFGIARRLLEPDVRAHPELLTTGWARRARPLFEGEIPGPGLAAPLVEGLIALVAESIRARGPMILAVDDAQWADPASLALLVELAQRRQELGAGLVITITRGVATSGESALQRLVALAGPELITPAALSVAAVRELVQEELGAADDGFVERLAHAAGGNPLIVKSLLEASARRGQPELTVPDSLSRLVLSRLDDLEPHTQELARAVAVLRETPLHRAATLGRLTDGAVDGAADELIRRHVLADAELLRFAQPVVGEALLATIPPFRLATQHRRAAELLARDEAGVEHVAAHLARARPAGDPWTCDTLRRAAAAALERGDPATAARLLERALAEPPPPAMRGGLLVSLAHAQAASGSPAAIEAFQRALEHVQGRAERLDAWHGLSRMLYLRGEHGLAAAAASHGLAELPAQDPRRERLLGDELAAATFVPELAGDAVARTVALIGGPQPSDPTLLAHLIIVQAWRGIQVQRLPELAAAAVAGDPLVDPASGGFGLIFVAGALNMVDQTPLSCELLDAGLERVAERGDPLAEVSLRCCRAWAQLYQGNLALARQDLDAVQALNRLGWSAVNGLSGPPLVRLRLELGDLDGARDALRHTPPGVHNPGLAWFEGSIAYAAGDYAAALDAFERAGAELEGMLGMGNPGVLPWRSSAALAAEQLGLRQRAEALVAPELEQAESMPVPRALGIALRVAGLVTGDVALLERSVTVLEPSPAQLELARSLLFLGIAYRRARRTRDARAPLGRALDCARELGAVVLAERVLRELKAAGARPRSRPRTGLEALTPSERNVAELAAAGKTTRQIASDLFLTPKTVETHLTRVFRKLRISSRAQLEPILGSGPDPVRSAPLA